MNFQPHPLTGTLRNGFSGVAANDEEPPLHKLVLSHMNAGQEEIAHSFRAEMADVFRSMNIDAALTRQSGMLNGVPLGTDILETTYSDIAVWQCFAKPLWDVIIDSYIEDLQINNPEKFETTYATTGQACVDYYKDKKQHLDIDVVRMAFEDSFKDEIKTLKTVADILVQNLPGVRVVSEIVHEEGKFITPIVRLYPPAGHDLRDVVRRYIDQKPGNIGLVP